MAHNNYTYEFAHVQRAICELFSIDKDRTITDHGSAIITAYDDKTVIHLDLYDLPPGVHGFHIHELGDLRNGCMNAGSHYNPFNRNHGGLNYPINHVGDLGNITVNESGRCNTSLIVNYLPLSGPYSVIGRSMVVHSHPDDLGLGDHKDSLTTGNSGSRIACGVIGYM